VGVIVKEGESTAQRTAAKSAVLQNKQPEGVHGRVEVMARKADHRLPKMKFQRVARVGAAEDPAGSRSEPRRP
jgi:hypothetical protein